MMATYMSDIPISDMMVWDERILNAQMRRKSLMSIVNVEGASSELTGVMGKVPKCSQRKYCLHHCSCCFLFQA